MNSPILVFLDLGLRGGERETALILALDHEDITLHAPSCTPRVLDNPVRLGAQGAITNNQDTVVEVVAAGGGEDTTRVELEGGLVGLNGDRDGAILDEGREVVLVARRVVDIRANRGDRRAGLASSLDTLVRVRRFGADAVLDDVLEGIVHETAIASLVAIGRGAVHELLLRERDQGAGRDGVGALDGASGGEGPARAALTLVLDGGNGVLGAPVQRGRDGASGDLLGVVLGADVFAGGTLVPPT